MHYPYQIEATTGIVRVYPEDHCILSDTLETMAALLADERITERHTILMDFRVVCSIPDSCDVWTLANAIAQSGKLTRMRIAVVANEPLRPTARLISITLESRGGYMRVFDCTCKAEAWLASRNCCEGVY